MHVFQPYPLSSIEVNPFEVQGKTGVCLTTSANGNTNTMATPHVGFGKFWGKDVIFTLIRENRYTKEILDQSEFFSVSFFRDKYLTSVKYIKSVSGRDENKIENAGFNINKHMNIPFIDEGHLIILCDKIASVPLSDKAAEDAYLLPAIIKKHYPEGNYHYLIIGEILEILAR